MRMTSATVLPTGISPLFAASLLLSVVGYNFCRRNYKTSSLPYCRYGFVFDLRVGRVSIVLLDVYIYPSGYLSELFGILGKSFFIDITCNHLGKIYEKGRLLLSFINFAVLFCLLVSWYWLPQQMNIAFLPLVLVLAVRSVTYIWVNRRKEKIAEKEIIEK